MDTKPRSLASGELIKLVEAAATITHLLRSQQVATKAACLRRSIALQMHQGDIGRVRSLRDQLSRTLLQQFCWKSPLDSSAAPK